MPVSIPSMKSLNLTATAVSTMTAAVLTITAPLPHSVFAADLPSGIDRSLISDEVGPGEDFYRYANARWLDETPIPPDKSDYGIFTKLDDETRQAVRELIESAAGKEAAPGTPEQKVGDLYRSVLNVETRNELGLQPIAGILSYIGELPGKPEVAHAMGGLLRDGVSGPLVAYVDVDARDSDRYTVYVTQSGLTLPDRDYYLSDEPRYKELRQKLVNYAADLLKQADVEDPDAAAQQILEIETAIAAAQWTKTENRDPVATYNAVTPEQFADMVSPMPAAHFINAAQLGAAGSLVVRQPSYFEALGKLFEQTPLEAWRHYLMFKTLDAYADTLTEGLERRHFEFHGTAVSGLDEQQPMWKRAVDATNALLGEVVGQVYVDTYFKPQAKERMDQLVDNLNKAFEKRLAQLEWMTEGTRRQALRKLESFTTKIGYPDEWKDYDKLQISERSPATNALSAARFEHDRELDKLGGPIDRNEWHMTPQTINAYYNPTMNEIVFPAAILQPPFFDMTADDAANYGGIGAVIGHEISHGFDDKGSKYDGAGNLRDWWTAEDRQEFESRAAGLVEQYNDYRPFDDQSLNGELTLGENIGDLGGLSVAYQAYRMSLQGREAPVIDGLTGDQRFFLSWAQIWRRLYRETELRKRLLTDPHSPSRYRTNGIVRNLDAWYDAFDITPEDPMYLAPEDRVRIW